jgi:hypothetical protein
MHIAPYLPSPSFRKKVLILVITIAIFVGLFWGIKGIKYLVNSYKIKSQIKSLPLDIQSQVDILTVGDLQKKDSNNNGIPDWEERLYGLDPLINGEENLKIVTQKREELKSEESQASLLPNTKTNEFARDFLRIITSLQTNGALNDEAVQNIATSVSDSFISKDIPQKITERDISIVRDSEITQRSYMIALSNLESVQESKLIGYELVILAEALKTNNPRDFGPLVEVENAYQVVLNNLKAIPVPQSYAGQHIALLNGLYNAKESISLMRLIPTDPVLALQGFVTYSISSNVIDTALANLGQ